MISLLTSLGKKLKLGKDNPGKKELLV